MYKEKQHTSVWLRYQWLPTISKLMINHATALYMAAFQSPSLVIVSTRLQLFKMPKTKVIKIYSNNLTTVSDHGCMHIQGGHLTTCAVC